MSYTRLHSIIKEAVDYVHADCRTKKGAVYAANILLGLRTWSGSDLKGNARRFGRSYADRRADARDALELAGGELIRLAPAGRQVVSVRIGQDDFGNALYQTYDGVALVTGNSLFCKIIKD